MAEFKVKVKGNASPKGKPRVYFTCHPADFEKYFEKLCADIFKSHDCAIYYTEDMSAVIEEQDKATDLGSNNLFIVPVTFKLLTQPNRAMDSDIPYALQQLYRELGVCQYCGGALDDKQKCLKCGKPKDY